MTQAMTTIDLNADMGESFGAWTMGDDAALLDVVSSANVACGFHAGDPLVLEVHARYVDENRRIIDLVRAGHFGRAAAAMELYLLRAEAHIVRGESGPEGFVTEL